MWKSNTKIFRLIYFSFLNIWQKCKIFFKNLLISFNNLQCILCFVYFFLTKQSLFLLKYSQQLIIKNLSSISRTQQLNITLSKHKSLKLRKKLTSFNNKADYIYQFFYRMESLQLRNIQNIENSLSLLKLKIQSMTKLNSQKEQALDKLILSTIPLVQKKLKENEVKEHMEQKKTFYLQRSNSLKKQNQESRLINEKEITRSRQLLTLMKHHNSLHLKESKKQNEERIKKIKEISLIKKREQRCQVKKREEQSQAKIQNFRIQKQSDIKLRRVQQAKQNQEKIESLMNKLKDLAQKEQLMQQKIRSSEESISKFKKVIHKVQKMKCDEFNKFRQQVVASPEQKGNCKSISEAILLYAASKNK